MLAYATASFAYLLIHVSVGAPFRAESSFLQLSECRVSGARIGTRSVVFVPEAGVELTLAEAEAMLGGVKLIA